MATSLTTAVLLAAALAGTAEAAAGPAPQSKIDELTAAHRKGTLCSDAVFLRRVYLDAIGNLPTAQEASAFLADRDTGKRRALVDRLLQREEFADYQAMKWGDVLRVKAEFPVNLWPNAAQAYDRWIRTSLRDKKPYDRFARELLTSSGSNFRVPAVNFYRAVQSRDAQAIAQAVAFVLMGTRAERWPADRLSGMAAFFSRIAYKETGEWKEEIVLFDPSKPAPAAAVFPDGSPARIAADRDPREVFADWLVRPDNPWFARSVVNRIWYWLLGRGIVHEPDDIRPDNPPANPELLAFLERELVSSGYDLKHIYRLILNSRTYQQATVPASEAQESYAHYAVRRLEAEVLIDAIGQVTGTTEKYTSAIPEPYTFMPDDQRAVSLPDGSISSPFLELFGRPPRDTGLASERNNRASAGQRLHLLNSTHVQRKLEQGPKLQALMRGAKTPRALATALYLSILSRYPTEGELSIVRTYSQSGVKGREAAIDLAWALINSTEFLYRH